MPTIVRAADLAVVGANGGGWAVDLGADTPAAPTNLDAPVSPWLPLGAISDDGLTYGFDEDSEQFTPWGLAAPFRTEVTKSIRTFGLTAWETNRGIVKSLQYRLPVATFDPDVDGFYAFAENAAPTPDRRGFLFHIYDGGTMEAYFVPQGEVTDRSDVKFDQKDIAGYEWTITAYPDDIGNTVYHVGTVAVSGGGGGGS
jgi:hypothetical protein